MSVPLRSPAQVMRLERMGSRFQTRISFMRSILRRLREEKWSIEQTQCNWDDEGYGHAVYRAKGPKRAYSLIAYTNYLDAADRSDRVIAERWDATFTLFDGEPTKADIDRLRDNVPKQEAGRCSSSELTLSRANKSVRLFEHVVDSLANGRQPDIDMIAQIGYLMRTTAVYGNGKFGLSDRDRTCHRDELATPYQAELLTVYLIRCFTHDLVEHVAKRRNPDQFVPLDNAIRRYLGIGNSTGLGMAPFIYHHPTLINNWILAMETGLAAVRSIDRINNTQWQTFLELVNKARSLSEQWNVADERQMQRVLILRDDLDALISWLGSDDWAQRETPWNVVYQHVEATFSVEAQEMVASLLIEMHPEKVDHLAATMGTTELTQVDPTMTLDALSKLLETHYRWALDIDFDDPTQTHFFWYASEEKLEPRVGERYNEPGADREHRLTAARDVSALYADIHHSKSELTVAEFLLSKPQHRHIIRRAQTLANFPYAEIQENLLGNDLLPIDMLRFKLSFFGATKFDPKSDKWTRINMYQGAPLPNELTQSDSDRWMLLPQVPQLSTNTASAEA